jgi:hypothetical protein
MHNIDFDNSNYIPFRYDYFVIWNHGLKFKDDILKIIENCPEYEIVRVLYHRPRSIKKLIKVIYSFDYAPIDHLKNKTKYLESGENRVFIIVIKNNDAKVDLFGKGEFRHSESTKIKNIKNYIRDLYNPKISNQRTEDHVIHASDNQNQTDYFLKYLGYESGIKIFERQSSFLNAPFHLGKISKVIVKKVPVENIYCSILEGDTNGIRTKVVPVGKTPHYRGLSENIVIYRKYIDKYLGYSLFDYYSEKKYSSMYKSLTYNSYLESSNLIVTKQTKNGDHLIQDGVHRICILKKKGHEVIVIAQIVS